MRSFSSSSSLRCPEMVCSSCTFCSATSISLSSAVRNSISNSTAVCFCSNSWHSRSCSACLRWMTLWCSANRRSSFARLALSRSDMCLFSNSDICCVLVLATLRLRKLLALIHLARLEMPDLRLECVPLLCEAIAACRLDFPRLLQVVDALCQCLDLCPQAGLCPLHFLCFYQLLRLGTQAIFKACPLFDLRLLEMLGFVVVARQDVRLVRLVVNEGLGHAEVLFDAILLLAKSGCDSFETREHGEPKFVDCRHVYAAPVASILQELGKIECGIGLAGLVTRVIRVAAIARLQRMLARGRVRVGRSASRRHFHHSSGVMAVLRSPLFRLCCWWRYWCGVDRKASQLHRLTGKLFDLPNNNQLIMRDVFPLGSRCTSFLCLKVVWVV
eukprot:Opistho-2@62449